MGSTRIRGNKKPTLTLATPGTDQAADLISYKMEAEKADADAITFEDAERGDGFDWFLRGSAIQSLASASFWRWCWENRGTTAIPFTLAPHGNAEASADEPHFIGTLTVSAPPAIGGEASTDAKSSFQFDYEFKLDAEPTMDVGTGV